MKGHKQWHRGEQHKGSYLWTNGGDGAEHGHEDDSKRAFETKVHRAIPLWQP